MSTRSRLSRERVILPTQPPSSPIDGDMYWDPAADPGTGGGGSGSYVETTEVGAANGVAPLDATVRVPAENLPITVGAEPSSPVEGEYWLDPAGTLDAPGAASLFVGPQQPEFAGPGLWVQTGLGSDGTGMTIWIEDGT